MSDAVQLCTWCNGTGRRAVRHAGTGELHGMVCACRVTDLPIPFVYQLEDNGCGVAAIAMATSHTYADVRRLLSVCNDLSECSDTGVDFDQVEGLLDQLGFSWQTRFHIDNRLHRVRDPWPCNPWADVHICNVRSLSDYGYHYVVWLRDGRVLDPWWGVVQGLHRYPSVRSIKAVYPIATPQPSAATVGVTE